MSICGLQVGPWFKLLCGVHDYTGSRILDSGVLPGLLQSSVRAEIYAVLHALRLTVHHAGSVYIWTDCDAVFGAYAESLQGPMFALIVLMLTFGPPFLNVWLVALGVFS